MTSIGLALLTGFLTQAQASELSVYCMVHKVEKGTQIECALIHHEPGKDPQILERSFSPTFSDERIPVAGLRGAFCLGIESVLTFDEGKAT